MLSMKVRSGMFFASAVMLGSLGATAANAATIVTLQSTNANYSWLTGSPNSLWSDGLAPHADAEYTADRVLRTTANNASTFSPKLTMLAGGTLNVRGPGTVTELHMNGGAIANGQNSSNISLAGTIYIDAATTVTVNNSTYANNMAISAALIGNNTITVKTTVAGAALTLSGNSTQFTGDWNITALSKVVASGTSSLGSGNISVASGATLDLNYALDNSSSSLTLDGILVLDQNLTFGHVTIAGQSLAGGMYTYADLKDLFSANIADGGSGSITVAAVPEPAAFGLLSVGLMGLLIRRKSGVRA